MKVTAGLSPQNRAVEQMFDSPVVFSFGLRKPNNRCRPNGLYSNYLIMNLSVYAAFSVAATTT